MKTFHKTIVMSVFISLALPLGLGNAAESIYITISGKIHSFDESQIKLVHKGKTFKVPRSSILPGYELKAGEWVRAQLKRNPASSKK